ncbi:MAG: IS1380 family transposase [Nitrospirae bacterium]|nr:IS1380 family transposase [Nitrospirota bacterium]
MGRQKRQPVLFKDLYDKPVSVEFTRPHQTSDGGVILLDAMEQKMGLIHKMAQSLRDPRQPGKVVYLQETLLRERVFAIACGYPTCEDADRLAYDPALKMVSNVRGWRLASQPTLSRFENVVSRTDLFRIALAITDTVIEWERGKRKASKVRRIIIDMDPTDDPTYGDQQLTFFNAYDDTCCYLPMVTTIQFDHEPDQYQIAPVLRPGNAKGSLGAIGILKRLVPRLREAFPNAQIYARMDGAFAAPEVLSWLEAHDLRYLVNMAKNSVLKGFAEPLLKKARALAKQTNQTATLYGEVQYKAGRWKEARRAVIKAEVVALEGKELRNNPRIVITNISRTPQGVYRLYRERGKRGERNSRGLRWGRCEIGSSRSGRSSASRFAASFWRCPGRSRGTIRGGVWPTVWARSREKGKSHGDSEGQGVEKVCLGGTESQAQGDRGELFSALPAEIRLDGCQSDRRDCQEGRYSRASAHNLPFLTMFMNGPG